MKSVSLFLVLVCACVAEAQNGFFATAPWMQPNGGNLIGDWNRGSTYSANGYGYQATGVPAYRPYYRPYYVPSYGDDYGSRLNQRFQTWALEDAAQELRWQRLNRQIRDW